MTETDVLSTDTASVPEAAGGNDAPTSGSGGTERRRRGGVSGMVLAELRELAGTLGVDTAGLRRGDLINEIKKRQSGAMGAGAAQLPLGDDADVDAPAAAAPAERAELDAQLQQMSVLQQQARALQAQPRASRDDALRALETSVRQNLGPNAQMQSVNAGEGVTVALRAVPADMLAQWLTAARGNARAVPREAHFTHGANAGNGAGGGNAPPSKPANPSTGAGTEADRPRWDGTLVMGLPAR